ncbi:hypothetical protein [Flavonifractor sp. An100]|uniref:hypothetical protein n=1 Tax=Flavonifractor sp. An100 TaxID=1965538 RepID=UPI001FA88E97|nr:hypothetical protein [Flavonifractor sp. An100]
MRKLLGKGQAMIKIARGIRRKGIALKGVKRDAYLPNSRTLAQKSTPFGEQRSISGENDPKVQIVGNL